MRKSLAVLSTCLGLAVASPAHAAFHLMKVVEVFGGTPAAPSAQYIVLQMFAGGQNQVQTHDVIVFGANGAQIMTFEFPSSLPVGTNQTKILIATVEAEAFFGITADLRMQPVIPAAGGKVCFDTLDCVAWGTYSPTDTAVGTPFNSAASPVMLQPNRGLVAGKAIARRLDIAGSPTALEAGDDTGSSANDFVFAVPAPRNNAGQAGTAPASTCGNATLEGFETCDDGDMLAGNGCSATCIDEFCGDMIDNDTVETCDDGNATNGDGCDNNCKVTACGNGIVTTGETCDDGNAASGDGCDANCKPTGCGNGVTTTGESCDDGNPTSGDGCDANCTPTGCGNGIVTTGEACEPPGVGACDAQCQIGCSMPSQCADIDPCTTSERCESSECVVDPTPVDDNEPCTADACTPNTGVTHTALDDGTSCALPNDPGRAICLAGVCGLSRCGDGFIDMPEQCDDMNSIDDDACTNACTTPRCGDRIVQSGETCDDGNLDGNDGCSSSCLAEVCGDGTMQSTETCDDGNAMANDGCSSTCQLESCGDGVEQTGEQCDDGNAAAGDGCFNCVFEAPGPMPPDEEAGGCCDTNRDSGTGAMLLAIGLVGLLRRRRR